MKDERTTAELEQLVERHKRYYRETLRHQPVSGRIAKLKQMRRWIMRHRAALIETLHADFNKPAVETELSESKVVLAEIDHALRHIRHWAAERRVPTPVLLLGGRSRIRVEPKGVVLIIAPWNFPFNLAVGPLVSAVAAGNSVVVKPSEYTPRTAALIESLARDIFNPDEVSVIQGGPETAAALTRLPFDHIFFTGSPQVGKKVMAAAAEHLTPVTLELGGQNPVIVAADADVRQTAKRLLYAKVLNAGQSCVSANYVLAHHSVKAPLMEALKQEQARLAAAGGERAGVINDAHARRLTDWLVEARTHGARVMPDDQLFLDSVTRQGGPVILEDVAPESKVMQNEIFGPLLPVISYNTLDEALRHIERRPYPLALYIFSRNRSVIRRIIRETVSGAVGVNETTVHFFNNDLPFGGAGYSGMGSAHGYYGFRAFSRERAVFKMPARFSIVDLIRPPYDGFSNRIKELIMRFL